MKQQPDDEDRRAMSRALVQCMFGFGSLEELNEQMSFGGRGLKVRQLPLADGGTRFVILELRNGKVYDHFDYSKTHCGGPGFPDDDSDDEPSWVGQNGLN